MHPDTLSTLTRVFERLDWTLLPDIRNFSLNHVSITFEYGLLVGYRGESETEWEPITLSWDELLDEAGDYPSLEVIAKERWKEARKTREAAEHLALQKEEERKRASASIVKAELAKKKESEERAEYERLRAKYEGKPTL